MITIQKDTPVNVDIIKRSAARAIPGAEDLLRYLTQRSSDVWQGFADGRIACIWGLIPPTILSETAWLWLIYAPDLVEEHKFIFVRNSQRFIEYALSLYPTIVGQVDPAQRTSVRWLKWLGAEFGSVRNGMMDFEIRRKP